MISYCITVYNEAIYIKNLIDTIFSFLHKDDEIVVVQTHKDINDKNTDYYEQIASYLRSNSQIIYHTFHFKHNFSELKNYVSSLATKPYILNLDADETISDITVESLKKAIADNKNIELFYLPRINIVDGLTQEDIKKWSWQLNENGWVNWPDYQPRLYKNSSDIKWEGNVHETIIGYKHRAIFPAIPEYAIMHHKTIDRQRCQNAFYDTIQNNLK